MKRYRNITAILLAVLLVCLSGCNMRQDTIRFGAAGVGGGYYAFATAYTQLAQEDAENLKFEVKTTAGTMANLRLLSEGYIDIAIAQADLLHTVYYGMEENGESYQGYQAIGGLYMEACQIVVRADSGIDSLEDLQGKKVSIGELESGTERNAKQILEVCGLVQPLVETVNLSYIEAAEQLKNGEIDAMFCTAGIKTNVISELASECEISLVGMDEKTMHKLQAVASAYEPYEIPANTYAGQKESVTTVGIRAILLVRKDMKEETVEGLVESLFEHRDELKYAVSFEGQLDMTQAVDAVQIPFHPGAKAYYEKQGISLEKQ